MITYRSCFALLVSAAFALRSAMGFVLPPLSISSSITVSRKVRCSHGCPQSSHHANRHAGLHMAVSDVKQSKEDLQRALDGAGRNAPLSKVIQEGSLEFARVLASDTVLTAVQNMNKINKGSTLVFTPEGTVAGIFTERDFVTKIVEPQRISKNTVISEVMTPASKLITVQDTMALGDAMDLMLRSKVRHLPVYRGSEIAGVVAMTDLVRVIKRDDERYGGEYPMGLTLEEIEGLQKVRANELAVSGGAQLGRQDLIRTSFVVAAALVSALILQGGWVHEHEFLSMCSIFALGYTGIIFEGLFEFNKGAVGLLMATALWVIYAGTEGATGAPVTEALKQLSEHVSEVSEVIFFLLGAMTIVEIVDAHQGFKVVTDSIKTKTKRELFWVIGLISFCMSGILDNLTTTIVMVSLLRKIVPDADDRKLFGSLIVIAANAGGAWTPIGDVTTTMLWINGQISALPTMKELFVPSALSLLVSTLALAPSVPNGSAAVLPPAISTELAPRGRLVFATGVAGLLSVPIFKALTGLPPYFGILSALGVMWALTDAIHAGETTREGLKVPAALAKIDTSGVLFFLGILLSIGALDSAGVLKQLALTLDANIPSQELVAAAIGLASALIDNVPLVAASMGMYDLHKFPMDSDLWQLIAYCAGTGGSILVIGSAAGVALMGLEKVDFLWYAKKISLPALAGYFAGVAAYIGLHPSSLSSVLKILQH